ncbi:STAS domain-containing protein [Actinomadura sp. LCR2-06]|uniref:STAS domain-containing protein n=1 Tax=Actinomadura violacea TaxID=2819934 RepID=A0ABS3RMW9_9ACTN|nr:STAS domain-containing protein [Actinomadura violacea]
MLVLRGELGVATAPDLLDYIARTLWAAPPVRTALELSGLTFCDSSGLNAFVCGWKQATATGGQFVLLCPPPKVADHLRNTGADRRITIAATLPE